MILQRLKLEKIFSFSFCPFIFKIEILGGFLVSFGNSIFNPLPPGPTPPLAPPPRAPCCSIRRVLPIAQRKPLCTRHKGVGLNADMYRGEWALGVLRMALKKWGRGLS